MAPPILYNNPLSPPCRLVRLIAGIVGVDLKVVNIKDMGKELKTPEMLKKNPQHTVPTLDDNGLCLAERCHALLCWTTKFEKSARYRKRTIFSKSTFLVKLKPIQRNSKFEKDDMCTDDKYFARGVIQHRAISMYLISKYAKDDSLYPKDVNKRVLVDQRLFYDQDLYNRILNVFLPKFFGKQTDPSSIEKVNEGLETLNRMLDGKQWLAGDKITLADYAVANSLSSLEFVPESGIDPTKQPNIKQWLPRVESSHPKYLEHLKEFREALKKLAQK